MSDYAGCDQCGAGQWCCNHWELEAGKWVAVQAEQQARLDQLRWAHQHGRGVWGQ